MLVPASFLRLASAGPVLATLTLQPRWAGDFVRRDAEALPYIPRGWERVARAPQDHVLTLRVGLKQDRFDELGESCSSSSSKLYNAHGLPVNRLEQISDPSHSDYGRHLSKE